MTAALARAQTIGGAFVDDQRRQDNFQKTMRRFAPAGSVFFFESDGPVTVGQHPLTETPDGEGNFGQIGFGSIAMTSWDYV